MRITTPEELYDKLVILEKNLPTYKTDVNADNNDLTIVSRDKTNLGFTLEKANIMEVGKKSCNGIKAHVYNGDENEPVAKYPVFSNDAPPEELVGGCLQRYMSLVKRIKASKGYTKDIGIALGIEDTKQKPAPDSVVPALDAFAAKMNYGAAVVVGNRGESDMWKVFMRRLNSETQQEIASGTGKSADITIVPTTDGLPEKIELTVRLYKNNKPYGQPSNPVALTVSP